MIPKVDLYGGLEKAGKPRPLFFFIKPSRFYLIKTDQIAR